MSTYRVKEKDLQEIIKDINRVTNNPESYSTLQNDGTYKTNVGHYHLSCAYGGYNLHQIVNDGGGITTPLGGGYHTKKELYNKLYSFYCGLCTAKENKSWAQKPYMNGLIPAKM